MADTIVAITERFDFAGHTGVAFPGVVLDGVALTAANLNPDWIGESLLDRIGSRLPGPGTFLNDADAAGLAEAQFGAAKDKDGVVLVITFGTGIGVAMINNGHLVANSELGHLEINGVDAETYAAASARERNQHSWQEWGAHADHYLRSIENLVWPNLFVLGGGITKNLEKWLHFLHPRTPITLAQHINKCRDHRRRLGHEGTLNPLTAINVIGWPGSRRTRLTVRQLEQLRLDPLCHSRPPRGPCGDSDT